MSNKPKKCGCKSKSGVLKANYGSRGRAVSVALKRGWAPTTFPCPKVKGRWHLTSG